MLTLALETGGELGSVALGADDGLLAESLLSVRATHSETVMPEVDRLLGQTGRGRDEIDAVAVGAGPGSFTGVRIAASLAKGLCFGRDRRLFAYSSLLAAAAGTGVSERVVACFDARRREVYAAAYDRPVPGGLARGPEVTDVETLMEELPGGAGGWTWAGSGADRHRETIEAAGGRVVPPHVGAPRAGSLLWLVRRHPEAGRVDEPATWEPEYVRRSSAWRGGGEAGGADGAAG